MVGESQRKSVTDSETTVFALPAAYAPASYSEVEDSFELEISQRLFAHGQRHYQSKDYLLVRRCLAQEIAKEELLSPKRQRKLPIGGIKLLLA